MMRALTVLLSILATANGARADAIAPPPSDCPYGSLPDTGHFSGAYCQVGPCTTDADCEAYAVPGGRGERERRSLVCRPAAICVTQRSFHRYIGRSREPAGVVTVDVARADCADAACADGECRRASFCVPVSEARPLPPSADPAPEEPEAPATVPAPAEPEIAEAQPAAAVDDSSGLCTISHRPREAPSAAMLVLVVVGLVRLGRSKARAA